MSDTESYSVLAEVDREINGVAGMKSKGAITRARKTVVAAGKSAAERSKALAGEVANAAATAGATARAASTAAASAVLDTVATAIQASALKGADAVARVGAPATSLQGKRSRKRWLLRKSTAPKKKAKKPSRKAARKKRV